MIKVVVVDTRESFSAEMTACLRSLDVEVVQIMDPLQLRDLATGSSDVMVALWAECPDQAGLNIPCIIMRAIAASRFPIPVVLYASHREPLTGLLEPGMQYPSVILSAHACAVAGVVQRVVKQMCSQKERASAFEDWAYNNQVSLACRPGRVSVFSSNNNGGFVTLGEPQGPLAAVGAMLEEPALASDKGYDFY